MKILGVEIGGKNKMETTDGMTKPPEPWPEKAEARPYQFEELGTAGDQAKARPTLHAPASQEVMAQLGFVFEVGETVRYRGLSEHDMFLMIRKRILRTWKAGFTRSYLVRQLTAVEIVHRMIELNEDELEPLKSLGYAGEGKRESESANRET